MLKNANEAVAKPTGVHATLGRVENRRLLLKQTKSKYKLRICKLLAFVALSLGGTSVHANLIFDFSFENTSNGGGLVTGSIFGLVDNDTDQQASEVVVTSATDGLLLGVYETADPMVNITDNFWTVQAGNIINANYKVQGPPTSIVFSFGSRGGAFSAGINQGSSASRPSASNGLLTQRPPAEIPTPTPLALLAAGICAFGFQRKFNRTQPI